MVLVRLTFGSDIQGGFKSIRLGASLNIQRLGMNMVAYWGRFVPSLMIFSSFLKIFVNNAKMLKKYTYICRMFE